MFTRDADFSALAERALFVDKAFQKLYIQVDEEGSEAAAATGMYMQMIFEIQGDAPEKISKFYVFSGYYDVTFGTDAS